MTFKRSKSAFTILETLISLGIVSVILSSLVITNRVIQTANILKDDQAQMSALAQESLENMRLLQRSSYPSDLAPNSFLKNLGYQNQSELIGLSPKTLYGAFYYDQLYSIHNMCDYGTGLKDCKAQTDSGPIMLKWCSFGTLPSYMDCLNLVNPVKDGTASTITMGNLLNNYNYELIAARKTPFNATGNTRSQIIDMSNSNSAFNLSDMNSNNDFNYYSRKITITPNPTKDIEIYNLNITVTVTNMVTKYSVTKSALFFHNANVN